MNRYYLKDAWYTPNELSEMSGVAPHTIRDRLRRGYSVEEAIKDIPTHTSVKEFVEASYWMDWIGMPINDLHKIYWKWCVSHEFTPITKQGFSRQLFAMNPQLKIVPTKRGNKCCRIIRLKTFDNNR